MGPSTGTATLVPYHLVMSQKLVERSVGYQIYKKLRMTDMCDRELGQ